MGMHIDKPRNNPFGSIILIYGSFAIFADRSDLSIYDLELSWYKLACDPDLFTLYYHDHTPSLSYRRQSSVRPSLV